MVELRLQLDSAVERLSDAEAQLAERDTQNQVHDRDLRRYEEIEVSQS